MPLLRRSLPWLIAAALLYLLFRRYPLSDVLQAASLANVGAFAGFILVYFSFTSLADSWSLNKNLNHFGAQGTFSKTLRLRLAANLAMVLNFGIGQGILAYLIRQHYRMSFARSSSVLMFQMLNDLYLTLTISFAGTFFTEVVIGGLDLVPWIRALWAVATVASLCGYFIIRYTNLLARIPWQLARDLFHTFHQSGLEDYFRVMLWRLPLHCAGVTYMYFLALTFGVHIPLEKVITLLPLTIAIGAIPITPSGIGTVQVTAIYLFQNFVSGDALASENVSPAEIIFAMSISFTLAQYILKLLSGLAFYRYASNVELPESADKA